MTPWLWFLAVLFCGGLITLVIVTVTYGRSDFSAGKDPVVNVDQFKRERAAVITQLQADLKTHVVQRKERGQ